MYIYIYIYIYIHACIYLYREIIYRDSYRDSFFLLAECNVQFEDASPYV